MDINNIEINKEYFIWEYSWEYKISKVKILKETPCKFFYETLEGCKFNYSNQAFKEKLIGQIFKTRKECIEAIKNQIDYKIECNEEIIARLKDLKKTFI